MRGMVILTLLLSLIWGQQAQAQGEKPYYTERQSTEVRLLDAKSILLLSYQFMSPQPEVFELSWRENYLLAQEVNEAILQSNTAELKGPEGVTRLKERIQQRILARFPDLGLIPGSFSLQVLFTEFTLIPI